MTVVDSEEEINREEEEVSKKLNKELMFDLSGFLVVLFLVDFCSVLSLLFPSVLPPFIIFSSSLAT